MDGRHPWLLLDTSAPAACVGVCAGEHVLAEVTLTEPRRHAEELPRALARALGGAGVDFDGLAGVAVGCGPGSFVGVRVGLAAAKGICLARRLPLVGLGSLVALAGHEGVPLGDGVALLDARRGELYVQRVRHGVGRLVGLDVPRALAPTAAATALVGQGFAVGHGLSLLPEGAATKPILEVAGPPARGLAWALAARLEAEGPHLDELSSLLPAYCRPPDARPPGA